MNIVTRFFLDFPPPTVTAQESKITVVYDKKSGKHVPRKYMPPDLADAKEKYLAYLSRHKPPSPLTGPVGLSVVWYFHTPTQRLDHCWKTTRPDTDNLNKLLKDCMTQSGFWVDDSLVVREEIYKVLSHDAPGILITVCDLSEIGADYFAI